MNPFLIGSAIASSQAYENTAFFPIDIHGAAPKQGALTAELIYNSSMAEIYGIIVKLLASPDALYD
jgi:hypothetical protein|tara:strand:+ start:834 stop:1031 length:198 start_codon:yes stop_codon:yes gene_type:complete